MKKVLVIGSNSFSGSDFIDLLLELGTYEVLGVSRSSEKEALFLPYKTKNFPHFTFAKIDLNHDLKKLDALLESFCPEYVVNFAAQSEVAPSWAHPDHWFQTNAVALTSLANLLKEKSFLKKYVHISSPEVYGTCEGFITEAAPLNPSTLRPIIILYFIACLIDRRGNGGKPFEGIEEVKMSPILSVMN